MAPRLASGLFPCYESRAHDPPRSRAHGRGRRDMHRGHLDPAVATLPLPPSAAPRDQARGRALADLRARGVPIVTSSPSTATPPRSPPTRSGSGARRPEQGAQGDPAAQNLSPAARGRRSSPTARRAGRRRAEARSATASRADGPRIVLRRRLGIDTVILSRPQHHDVRAVRRLRGDEPRLPGVVAPTPSTRWTGKRLHRFAAKLIARRPRLAAHQRRDPPASRARFLKETDMRRRSWSSSWPSSSPAPRRRSPRGPRRARSSRSARCRRRGRWHANART